MATPTRKPLVVDACQSVRRRQDSAKVIHDMGKMLQGFSEPWGSPGALRSCWGNSLLLGGCSMFVRNVMKWSWWWSAGSGWAPLGRLPCDWLEHAGGEHPASPAAGHRGVQRSCISCCRDAPCLCCWGRRDAERSRLGHS